MEDNWKQTHNKNWLAWAGIYAAILIALMGFLNYTQPYSAGPVMIPIMWLLILWASLYLPVIVLPLVARWKVADFGFSLSPTLAIAALIVTVFCAVITNAATTTWGSATLEAFARTGEEVFFRGFLITVFLRLFEGKRRPWLWAAILSSVLFTLVHTQTFQQSFLSQHGSPSTPAVYTIVERFLNLLLVAFVLALIRVWTRSILPGAIAHSIVNGSIPVNAHIL